MKIGILGTRGIPNHYGGFEQITEFLSEGLVQKGHEVTVYNSHNHPHKKNKWKSVHIIHCYDPEYLLNTAGQFVYDLNCILDSRKRDFDVLLIMGYSSSSIWWKLFPKRSVIVYNMDGLEWMRTKYNKAVRKFLKWAEKLAAKHSDFHIADSIGIRDHIKKQFGTDCHYIPYGANPITEEKKEVLDQFGLQPEEYFMLMARMEPENNIDVILNGFHLSNSTKKMLVLGSTRNGYGRSLEKKYNKDDRILFKGAVYQQDAVNSLRKNCSLYFHGHSVGGTNPSLLEAMAGTTLIAAHDNVFNRAILGQDGFYFSTAADVKSIVEKPGLSLYGTMKENNLQKINEQYSWQHIIDEYDEFLCRCYEKKNNEKTVYNRGFAYK